MKCKFCGEELQEGYKYCTNCGMKVEEEKKESKAPEYFEIVKKEDENSKYDFSGFLEAYKKEEERQVKETKEKRPVFNDNKKQDEKSTEDLNNEDVSSNIKEDNLEDTKKRKLFERTDYDVFESIKENKSKSFYGDEDEGFFTGRRKSRKKDRRDFDNRYNPKDSNTNRDYSVNDEPSSENLDDYVPKGYVSREDLKKLRNKDRARSVYHVVFNILVIVVVGLLCYFTSERLQLFIGDRIDFFRYIPSVLFLIMYVLGSLFLLIPFFRCKGQAKFPLLLLSILISWTLIGWIILMIVASLSNRKWDKKMREPFL